MSFGSRRAVAFAAVAALAACASDLGAGRARAASAPAGLVAGRLIVGLQPGAGGRAARTAAAALGATVERGLSAPGIRVLAISPRRDPLIAARRAERRPGVAYAEPDQLIEFGRTPNDPLFGRQWGLLSRGQRVLGTRSAPGADIAATPAWDLAVGNRSVVVADVDTGADLTHPDLAANIWVNPGEIPGNHVDDDGNGLADDVNGWDWADSDNVPDDSRSFDQGHGTETAGVIGAVGDNGVGIAGVSWSVSLMPLRAATLSETISAFIYARQKGARVVNFSAGFPFYSQALRDTIDNLGGVLVINAADNGGFDGRGDNSDRVADFPCKFPSPNLVCVAASDQSGRLARFSNFGPAAVDLAAPGVNVLSTYPPNAISYDLNEFFDRPSRNFSSGGRPDRWGLTAKLGGAIADSVRGRYRNRTRSFVTSRSIDLRQRRACELDFFLRQLLQKGSDRLLVQVSRNRGRWRTLDTFSGSGRDFHFLPLPRQFSGARRARARFLLRTDASGRRDGVYLDDVQVICRTTAPTYAYADGTSFASPAVAGAAALVLARFPAASTAEVKARLLGSVRRLPSMARKLASGGRLDAAAALR